MGKVHTITMCLTDADIATSLHYTDSFGKSLLHWVAQRVVADAREVRKTPTLNSQEHMDRTRNLKACQILQELVERAKGNDNCDVLRLMRRSDKAGRTPLSYIAGSRNAKLQAICRECLLRDDMDAKEDDVVVESVNEEHDWGQAKQESEQTLKANEQFAVENSMRGGMDWNTIEKFSEMWVAADKKVMEASRPKRTRSLPAPLRRSPRALTRASSCH